MRKFLSFFTLALAVVSMVACTSSHDKTIANLKAAIDGESTASAKYAAFAEQAAKDSLFAVEALFKATSQAEVTHINNHQAVLVSLGVTDYQPTIGAFEVKSTAENLQSGIEGETYEFTEMYPAFIKDAESEKVQGAIVSLNYAQDAEKKHAEIYADVVAKLATPEVLAASYYVCPKCGNAYVDVASESCELCQTGAADFLVFEASMPVAQAEQLAVK